MATDAELRRWDQQAKSMKKQIDELRTVEPMTAEIGLFILTLAHRRLDVIEQIEDVLRVRELGEARANQ